MAAPDSISAKSSNPSEASSASERTEIIGSGAPFEHTEVQLQLVEELRQKLADLSAEDDPEDIHNDTGYLSRSLRARKWKVGAAEKMLRETVRWRRDNRPMDISCAKCEEREGFHTWRQVGFCRWQRPVVYSCFEQAGHHSYTSEDSATHLTYLLENAFHTMPPGVEKWVWCLDFSGFALASCNPTMSKGVIHVTQNHYPERLGLLLLINPPWIFHQAFKVLKRLVDPDTIAKVCFVRGDTDLQKITGQLFDAELQAWLSREVAENKRRPLPEVQREYWKDHSAAEHDPRGTRSYLEKFVHTEEDEWPNGHRPHPNIILHAGHTHHRPNPGREGSAAGLAPAAAAVSTAAGPGGAGAAGGSGSDSDEEEFEFAESEL